MYITIANMTFGIDVSDKFVSIFLSLVLFGFLAYCVYQVSEIGKYEASKGADHGKTKD